ncbi:MAG: HAD-IA family hydrolase [Burkholderiales bacterium]|jgi:phosphoglycolate phosphatase|nr:HAD-IA family hydrolase [Burkholderiales bacterium]
MPSRFDLIVFDWDGTLADSAGLIARCIQQACADIGAPIPTEERARYVIGLGLDDALAYLVPGLPQSDYRTLADSYRTHYFAGDGQIPLFEGAKAALHDLRADGFRLAVATGKTRRGLDRAMRNLDVADCFDATRCADETASKPDPRMLHELFAELGIGPGRSLMIGDTTHDLDMARAADTAAVAVAYGAHPKAGLVAASPLACIDRFDELHRWLKQHA